MDYKRPEQSEAAGIASTEAASLGIGIASNMYMLPEEREKMMQKQQEYHAALQRLEQEKQLHAAALESALRFHQHIQCSIDETFGFAVRALKFLKGESNAKV